MGSASRAESAIAVLWFALTRDAAGVDWKVVTTAGSWHQLTAYTWPEIHKWAGKLRWDKVRDGRPFSRAHELQNINLKLSHGAAFAAASANSALIEGAHADSLMFVYDEAKAIPAGTFDACEGAFSGAGEGGTEAFALALSTPGAAAGPVLRHLQAQSPATRTGTRSTSRSTTPWPRAASPGSGRSSGPGSGAPSRRSTRTASWASSTPATRTR